MVSVLHTNKHLIKFPIDLDYKALRNKVEYSKDSTVGLSKHSKTILLKADTGADVNLMNIGTFDSLFDRSVPQLTPIRNYGNYYANYGNTGKKCWESSMHFSDGRTRCYKQLFYVTDCDKSPNLLSRDACYMLGVLKPFYTVEKELGPSRTSTDSTLSEATSIHWKIISSLQE